MQLLLYIFYYAHIFHQAQSPYPSLVLAGISICNCATSHSPQEPTTTTYHEHTIETTTIYYVDRVETATTYLVCRVQPVAAN